LIVEWLQSVTTPCPAAWRQMGYLHQAIGIDARYSRHRQAWQPHINHSRKFVLKAAQTCKRRRKAVLMGAAAVHDLPVSELADMFDEVVLVDLFHLWQTRWLARRNPKIKLQAVDLTSSLDDIHRGTIRITKPDLFLTDDTVDFVVSGNIASQLPLIPLDWLAVRSLLTEETRSNFGQSLIKAHIEYLSDFDAKVCLITDYQRLKNTADGNEVSRSSALFDVAPPAWVEEWNWEIAPVGEISPDEATSHIVIGAILGQNSSN
jgi:hypothetical protein